MRRWKETSARSRRISYHACAGVFLTTSDGSFMYDRTNGKQRTNWRIKRIASFQGAKYDFHLPESYFLYIYFSHKLKIDDFTAC